MTLLIRPGDRSDQVADVQARLRALGYRIDDETGSYEDSTTQTVRAFQQRRSILVDGLVGPNTWDELVEASWRLGDRSLYLTRPLMRGDDVLKLQQLLNAIGYDAGREDGMFGPNGGRAVRHFQREYGSTEDGIFGPVSHTALLGLRVDRPGTAASLREELLLAERADMTDSLIVIDPGHGGPDEGDRGPNGARESELCWDIAVKVAEMLTHSGAKVRFTRTEVEGPTISERATRANDLHGDVFVSIHLNSHDESNAGGASTYFFGGSRLGERLADSIQHELTGLGIKDCRSHARAYALLKETRMPAVLVEPCFISNPEEEKMLEDPLLRARVAEAIGAGVRRYYESKGR